jgi:chemosensory pili system protein ChpA (sensor histidine kinase/response regulator)
MQDFLNSPCDPERGLAMVHHLNSSQWNQDRSDQDVIDIQEWFAHQTIESKPERDVSHSVADYANADTCDGIGNLSETLNIPEESPGAEANQTDEKGLGLLLEAGTMVETFAELTAINATEGFNVSALQAALQHSTEAIERFAIAAAEADLAGLQQVCMLIAEGMQGLAAQQSPIPQAQIALLETWPLLAVAYAEAPYDKDAGEALLNYLHDPACVLKPSEEEAKFLRELLAPQTAEEALPESQSSSEMIAPLSEIEGCDTNSDVDEVIAATSLPQANSDDATRHEIVDADSTQPQGTDDSNPRIAPALDEAAQELVDLLRAELAELIEARAEWVAPIVAHESAQAERLQALEQYAEEAERISSAAELMGLDGLQQGVAQIHKNILMFAEQEPNTIFSARSILEGWPILVLGYLQTIHDRRASEALIDGLRNPQWPQPLSADEAGKLLDLLSNPVVATDEQLTPRQQKATPEDVSLEIPGDVNQELLDTLLRELPSQTEEFTASIQSIINGGFISDLDVAQRIAHTLKGSGNLVGVRGIANLTHHLEDILEALSKRETLPPESLAGMLMNAADCLEAMSEALLGVGAPPEEAVDVLQEVLDWANLIDREGIPKIKESRIRHKPSAEQGDAERGSAAQAPHSEPAAKEAMLRIPAALANHMLRLAGESIISTGQFQEQVHRTRARVKSLSSQHQLVRQLVNELEQLVDIRGITAKLHGFSQHSEFDTLEMDQYSELHTVTHRLLEASSDVGELTQVVADQLVELDRVADTQRRIHHENQEIALRTRMLPVKTVVPRLQRSVRQAARLTARQVNLDIIGIETLMDSEVLNDLMDPLMHMLRNAVDHGIEPPEVRNAQGKDSMGRIELEFARAGDRIIVRCRDDGKGLDFAAIRQIAEERGLVAPDKVLTEAELSRLILVSGFSTRSQVTQVSGRGVGMDVIHTRIKEMKGTLQISSQTGKGSQLELGLPVTLLAAHALLVRIGEQILALSTRGVEEILYPGAGELRKMGSKTVYLAGDNVYEARKLDIMLNLQPDRQDEERQSSPVLLIEEESGTKTAILVQEVLDSRDLVVKPLGQYVPHIIGVMGGAILGDGSVTPVLDLPELLHAQNVAPLITQTSDAHSKESKRTLPTVLVVDDSLSARRSLAQFIRDLGYDARTAQDGFEAVAIIEDRHPDIILADLEMPRMNGLELTSHVRAQDGTKDIPVIMITSRSTEKHRQQADRAGVTAYITKPFSEDALMEHIETALSGK